MSFAQSRKTIGCSILAIGFLSVAMAANSGPHPNFSGTWKLNVANSSFAPLPPLTHLVDTIEQTRSAIKIHRTQANQGHERTRDVIYNLDGAPMTVRHNTGDSKTVVRWEGANLVIESSLEFEGLPMNVRDRWSLRHEGRTLEIHRHFQSHQGAIDQKLVMERQ